MEGFHKILSVQYFQYSISTIHKKFTYNVAFSKSAFAACHPRFEDTVKAMRGLCLYGFTMHEEQSFTSCRKSTSTKVSQ